MLIKIIFWGQGQMFKKANTPIAVTILGFLIFVLVVAAMFTFVTRAKNMGDKIIPMATEGIYAKEELIRFYINQGKSLEDAVALVNTGDILIQDGFVVIQEKISDSKGIAKFAITYKFKP